MLYDSLNMYKIIIIETIGTFFFFFLPNLITILVR